MSSSSSIMTLRSAIMWLCVIGSPLAAIFGAQLQPKIQQWAGRCQDVAMDHWQSWRGQSTPTALPPAPLVSLESPGAAGSSGSALEQPREMAPLMADSMNAATLPTKQASYNAITAPAASADARANPVALAGSPFPDAALPSATASASPAPTAAVPKPQPVAPENDFHAIEQRLRTLGATYYLLETWGTHGELYRFHVKMAIAGNSNYTRHFEATDPDALRAMRRALDEIEQWKAGRSS